MTDIVELILAEHERFFCWHAVLLCARQDGCGEDLANAWTRLADLAQTNLEAEEGLCYPALFSATVEDAARKAEAIAAHRGIRSAIAEAHRQPVGSPRWWCAVKDALSGCFELFDAEERLLLDSFRRRASPALREALGRHWAAYLTARHRASGNPDVPASHGQARSTTADMTPLPMVAVAGPASARCRRMADDAGQG